MGIELSKLQMNDAYQPSFVIFPLWNSGIKECVKHPILFKTFYSGKSQIKLPYTATEREVFEAANIVQQSHLLDFDVSLKKQELFSQIDSYLSEPPQSSVPFSHLQASLWEAKFFIALYLDSVFAA